MGADLRRRGGSFAWRLVASGLFLNEPQFRFKKSPDRGTIGPRSRRDRATIVPSILDQRPSDEVEDECRRFRDEKAPLWR